MAENQKVKLLSEKFIGGVTRWILGGQRKRFSKLRTFHFSTFPEKMDSKTKNWTFKGCKVQNKTLGSYS